jgi:hypothetical protein
MERQAAIERLGELLDDGDFETSNTSMRIPTALRDAADSHLGAVIQSAPHSQITVVTSDPDDMRLVAGDKNITVTTV